MSSELLQAILLVPAVGLVVFSVGVVIGLLAAGLVRDEARDRRVVPGRDGAPAAHRLVPNRGDLRSPPRTGAGVVGTGVSMLADPGAAPADWRTMRTPD